MGLLIRSIRADFLQEIYDFQRPLEDTAFDFLFCEYRIEHFEYVALGFLRKDPSSWEKDRGCTPRCISDSNVQSCAPKIGMQKRYLLLSR